MKKLLVEEMSKPVSWGASPDISNRETIGIMVAIGLVGIFLKSFGLL
jgi:hypothetical protein|tara:strand:+ start:72 stop:212 length:141 start_codon:yes stop_codon:yes gene_type:complete